MQPALIASPIRIGANSRTYFLKHRMSVTTVPHMGPVPPERKPVRRAGIGRDAGRMLPEDG